MYKITLADGKVMDGLELNGNNFIADKVIENSVFDGNLGKVTISDGVRTETYEDMVLRSNRVENGRSWLVFGQKTQQEKDMARMENLETTTDDIILMMADLIGGE